MTAILDTAPVDVAPEALQALFEEANRIAQEPLGVDDPQRLAGNIADRIPFIQLIRELMVNCFHALINSTTPPSVSAAAQVTTPGRTVCLDRRVIGGVGKLCVWDSGCGMSMDQLVLNLNQLSRSGVSGGDRFGIGATTAGYKHSPAGLEYITWNGTTPPVRAIFGLRPDGMHGVMDLPSGNKVDFVSETELPEGLQRAGHGTVVIVHGTDAADPTYDRALQAVGNTGDSSNKGLAKYVNSKFVRWAKGTKVYCHTVRSRESQEPEYRQKTVIGLAKTSEKASKTSISGVVSGGGFKVRWYLATNGKLKDTAFQLGGVFAVALVSKETPELAEIYEMFRGSAAQSKLGLFGLTPLASRMIVIVEIDPDVHRDIRPTLQRTRLETDGHDIDYGYFAEVFKSQMPKELEEARAAALAQSAVPLDEAIDEALATLAKVLNGGATGLFGPGGRGAKSETPVGGHPGARERGPRSLGNGGHGHGRGGQGALEGTGTAQARRQPKVIPWDNVGTHEKALFASWEPEEPAIFVNRDCPLIDRELDEHLKGRSWARTRTSRAKARDIVVQFMTAAVVQAIIAAETGRAISKANGGDPGDWDYALEPQSLTGAGACSYRQRHREVAIILTDKVGK